MHVQIKHSTSGKTFSVEFYNKEGDKKAFFALNSCRIVEKKDGGKFVSGPSAKMEDGEWLNYAFIGEKLGEKILELYEKDAPKPVSKPKSGSFDDLDSDVPF